MKNTLKQGTIYLTIASIIFIITGYIINVILGRLLGPVSYGSYGVIVSLISLVNVLQTSGFTQSASKYIAEDETKAPEIFRSALIIQMIATVSITIAFFFLAPVIATILNDKSLTPYIRLAAVIFPLYGYYALLIDYNNGLHNFKKQALLNTIYSITKTVGVLSLAFLYQLKGVIFGLILAPLLPILNGFYFPKKVRFHFPYKKLIFFSLPLIGYIIFSTLQQTVDLYFVKAMTGGKEPGFYTASQNISRLIYFATIAVSSVLLPAVSRYVRQKAYAQAKVTIFKALRVTLLLVAPSVVLISATSNQLVTLIYSHEYIDAGPALALLVFGYASFTFYSILCAILNGAGRPVLSFVLSVVGVTVNALACYYLIPTQQLQGAALANFIGNFSVTLVASLIVYKLFAVSLFSLNSLKIVAASVLIFFLAKLLPVPLLLLPILYIALFGIYFSLLLFMKEITNDDITLVKSLIPNFSKYKKQHD
ncbi:MAG: lipopolysaccharide biosynthesis protein [Candidatus Levyibacteriota bacterium]